MTALRVRVKRVQHYCVVRWSFRLVVQLFNLGPLQLLHITLHRPDASCVARHRLGGLLLLELATFEPVHILFRMFSWRWKIGRVLED